MTTTTTNTYKTITVDEVAGKLGDPWMKTDKEDVKNIQFAATSLSRACFDAFGCSLVLHFAYCGNEGEWVVEFFEKGNHAHRFTFNGATTLDVCDNIHMAERLICLGVDR